MSPIQHDLRKLLALADFCDLSFSATHEAVEQRALIGWEAERAKLDVLSNIFCRWGISEKLVRQWQHHCDGAELVGIAVDQQLTSFRLYTHKWRGMTLKDVGVPVYTGFKQLSNGSLRIDTYVNHGDLRNNNNLTYTHDLNPKPLWIQRLLARADERTPLLFTRTTNPGRQSWLVTARYEYMDAGRIVEPCLRGHKLLHLAGGIDAVKGEFATAYIRAEAKEIEAFIEGQAFSPELGQLLLAPK